MALAVDEMRPNGWGNEATPKVLFDLIAMLGGGLTFKDNFNCAIVTVDAKHNTETRVVNPLTTKPIAFIPISAFSITAVGGQSNGNARTIDGYPILNTSRTDGFLGITVNYERDDQPINEADGDSSTSAANTATDAVGTLYSVTLQAGEWDVSAMVGAGRSTGTAVTGTTWAIGLSTQSGTFTSTTKGITRADRDFASWPNTESDNMSIGPVRFFLTAATTIYVVAKATFSNPAGVGVNFFGRLTAVRANIDPATLGRVAGILVGG